MLRASVTLEWFKLDKSELDTPHATALGASLTVNGQQFFLERFRDSREGKEYGKGSRIELEVEATWVQVAGNVTWGFYPPRDEEEATAQQIHRDPGLYDLKGLGWRARYTVIFTPLAPRRAS